MATGFCGTLERKLPLFVVFVHELFGIIFTFVVVRVGISITRSKIYKYFSKSEANLMLSRILLALSQKKDISRRRNYESLK